MSDTNNNNTGGFAKTTDFKWLGIGLLVFILIAFIMPTPESMTQKAQDIFGEDQTLNITVKANHIQTTMSLLATRVAFFLSHIHL